MGVETSSQAIRQCGTGEAFRNDVRIVPQSREEFTQDFWPFGMTRHPIYLSLQFFWSDRLLPVVLQRLGIAQVIVHLFLDLRLRHQSIERWPSLAIFAWPIPV